MGIHSIPLFPTYLPIHTYTESLTLSFLVFSFGLDKLKSIHPSLTTNQNQSNPGLVIPFFPANPAIHHHVGHAIPEKRSLYVFRSRFYAEATEKHNRGKSDRAEAEDAGSTGGKTGEEED